MAEMSVALNRAAPWLVDLRREAAMQPIRDRILQLLVDYDVYQQRLANSTVGRLVGWVSRYPGLLGYSGTAVSADPF